MKDLYIVSKLKCGKKMWLAERANAFHCLTEFLIYVIVKGKPRIYVQSLVQCF